MKRIIYIFTFLLLSMSSMHGQNIRQWYFANIDFYVGTWRYTNATTNEEFTIKLRKTVYLSSLSMIREDCIVGTYIYKKNGVIVLDNMNEFMIDRVYLPGPIYATNARETAAAVNPNKLETTVQDYGILSPASGRPKSGRGTITIISAGNPKKIHWFLKDREGPRIVGHSAPMGFIIPTDIILTKID